MKRTSLLLAGLLACSLVAFAAAPVSVIYTQVPPGNWTSRQQVTNYPLAGGGMITGSLSGNVVTGNLSAALDGAVLVAMEATTNATITRSQVTGVTVGGNTTFTATVNYTVPLDSNPHTAGTRVTIPTPALP
jgi:hypothetical protein